MHDLMELLGKMAAVACVIVLGICLMLFAMQHIADGVMRCNA